MIFVETRHFLFDISEKFSLLLKPSNDQATALAA